MKAGQGRAGRAVCDRCLLDPFDLWTVQRVFPYNVQLVGPVMKDEATRTKAECRKRRKAKGRIGFCTV